MWEAMFGEEKPPTVLLGHSFGGAIAVWTAKDCSMPSLQGLIVIDVVEGTAIGVYMVHEHANAIETARNLRRLRTRAYSLRLYVGASKWQSGLQEY